MALHIELLDFCMRNTIHNYFLIFYFIISYYPFIIHSIIPSTRLYSQTFHNIYVFYLSFYLSWVPVEISLYVPTTLSLYILQPFIISMYSITTHTPHHPWVPVEMSPPTHHTTATLTVTRFYISTSLDLTKQ